MHQEGLTVGSREGISHHQGTVETISLLAQRQSTQPDMTFIKGGR